MKKSSASFLGRGLFLCIALTGLFISCENFMEDSNFTSMLQSDIAYANSEVNEIRLECEEGAGTFSSSSVLYKKATDTFDVEFKKKH